jgi:hypothetical protein
MRSVRRLSALVALVVALASMTPAVALASAGAPQAAHSAPTAPRLRDRIKRMAKRTLQVGLLTLAAHAATLPIVGLADRFVEPQSSTVVFAAGHAPGLSTRAASALVDYFMYTPVTLRQLLRGHRVDWISDARASDVLADVRKPQYQNVVFVGHGSQGSFWAYDHSVYAYDLRSVLTDKKTGETVQYTCGFPDGPRISEAVLKDPSKGIYSGRDIMEWENFVGAWKLVVSNRAIGSGP